MRDCLMHDSRVWADIRIENCRQPQLAKAAIGQRYDRGVAQARLARAELPAPGNRSDSTHTYSYRSTGKYCYTYTDSLGTQWWYGTPSALPEQNKDKRPEGQFAEAYLDLSDKWVSIYDPDGNEGVLSMDTTQTAYLDETEFYGVCGWRSSDGTLLLRQVDHEGEFMMDSKYGGWVSIDCIDLVIDPNIEADNWRIFDPSKYREEES